MTDLPDRTNITHDDCSTIIAAWRNGRLIDREAIDYDAAVQRLNHTIAYAEMTSTMRVTGQQVTDWAADIVDAALGDKETTT